MGKPGLDLKYLFGVKFVDNSEYWQTPEDVSLEEPDKRTACYDISQRTETNDLICGPDGRGLLREDISVFVLESVDKFNPARYAISLNDGHFEVRVGKTKFVSFFIKIPPKDVKLLPLYFRRRRHHATAVATANGDGTASLSELKEIAQECEYHVGWCYIQDGKLETCEIIVG